jgi:hypothetical protein
MENLKEQMVRQYAETRNWKCVIKIMLLCIMNEIISEFKIR